MQHTEDRVPQGAERAEKTCFPSDTRAQEESQLGLSIALIETDQAYPGLLCFTVRTVFCKNFRMLELWKPSVTAPATLLLIFQAGSWDHHKRLNGDYAQICIASYYGPQLSSQCLHFSRKNKVKNRFHKNTSHVYCIPPIKQTRLYKKPTKVYHAPLPQNIHQSSCLYTHKSLHSSNRQKVKIKNIVLRCLEMRNTSTIAMICKILGKIHHKPPSSKVMLHSAPQIKLWGGEDLEGLRENFLLSKTSPKPTKNSSSLKYQIPTLQVHYLKYMPSYKYKRVNWYSSYKKYIQSPGPQSIFKTKIVPSCIQSFRMYLQTSMNTRNMPYQIKTWSHIKYLINTYYKNTRTTIHFKKYLKKNHRSGFQHIYPLTYTIGITNHKLISLLSPHPTLQSRI